MKDTNKVSNRSSKNVSNSEAKLRVQLFGTFTVTSVTEGHVISIVSHKCRCLLAYLLLSEGKSVTRDKLSTDLWPESGAEQGRTNLRRELYTLRRTHSLLDSSISSNKNSITWTSHSACEVDLEDFLVDCKRFHQEADAGRRLVAGQIAANYDAGELLVGMDDEWVTPYRDKLKHQWIRHSEAVLPLLEAAGDLAGAIELALRLVKIEPYRESSTLALMRLYKESGNRGLALHAYHTCASLLDAELGVLPSEELRQSKDKLLSLPDKDSTLVSNQHRSTGQRRLLLVGREQEQRKLTTAWENTCDGNPMLLLVSGEAGIGKTALLRSFVRNQPKSALPVLSARCYSAEGDLPFAAIVSWLQSLDIESLLPQLPPAFRFEVVLAFPEIIKHPVDVPKLNAHPPNRARGRLFEALARLLEAVACPVTLALDDIQWVDRDTLEWIRYVFRSRPKMPVLFIASLRDTEIHDAHPIYGLKAALLQSGNFQEVALKPLPSQEIRELVEQEIAALSGDVAFTTPGNVEANHSPLIDAACRQSNGNPLFALEIVRYEMVSPDYPNTGELLLSIPPVIQSVLELQVRCLSVAAKVVIDIASVAGRHLTPQVIEVVSDNPAVENINALEELWSRKILREDVDGRYLFRHELFREVCYGLLSPPRRRNLHARIAAALIDNPSPMGGSVAGQVAMHYGFSGDIKDAYKWSCQAAADAEKALAVRDSISFHDSALRYLGQLDPNSVTTNERVKLLLNKSKLVALVDGFSAPTVVALCTDISKLLPKVDDANLKRQVMLRLRQLYSFGGFPRRALRLTNELISQSMRGTELLEQVEAYRLRSITQVQIGRFQPACESMQAAAKIAERAISQGQIEPGNTPFSVPMLNTIWALVAAIMGHANESAERLLEAQRYDVAPTDFFSNSLLLLAQANAYQQLHRPVEVLRLGEQLSALAQESHLPKIQCVGDYFQGWATARLGSAEEGIARIIRAFDRFPANADHHLFPFWYAHLAELQVNMNRPEEALNSARLGIQSTRETRETVWCAELFRVRGLAMAANGFEHREVMGSFEVAFAIGKRQQAKLFQLRSLNDQLQHCIVTKNPTASLSKTLFELSAEVLMAGESEETKRAESLLTDCR